MSPKKKKAKLSPNTNPNKRANEPPESPRKRLKPILSKEEEIKARRKKNFVTACEQVSYRDYFDYRSRFLLVYLPSCVITVCKHQDNNAASILQMPPYAEESFKTEMKNSMWYEALEVCYMCITPTQYLSANILKDVIEIILNVHEDKYSEYTAKDIINKCQQVLMQNFSAHPPCIVKNLRNCYINFLTSPMALKDNTFTDRSKYECNKGIVKYCMNRLENELSAESKDEPLVDKDANIPEEMKLSVRGLHWQKENFDIYELLNRQDRIERLFAVLETVIELLQFDLVIWHNRYTNNLGRHIMRSHRPIMAYVLWSDNVLYTGAVTNNCRQILRIFAHLVHLEYPDSMVRIMTSWLNAIIQTFYICEINSNMDYPNTSKYCTTFANDFYRIISAMPHDSINRILERIEPSFMRHMVGLLHGNKILSTNEDCIIRILINFINGAKWRTFQSDDSEIKLSKKLFLPAKKVKKKINYLLKECEKLMVIEERDSSLYKKIENFERNKDQVSLNHIIHSLYTTLEACLDAYDVESVQETWNNLNNQLLDDNLMETESVLSVHSCYSVTESLIKKYRNMLQSIKELVLLFRDLKNRKELPEVLSIFGNIGLLDVVCI